MCQVHNECTGNLESLMSLTTSSESKQSLAERLPAEQLDKVQCQCFTRVNNNPVPCDNLSKVTDIFSKPQQRPP
jgi:hypothetical protein